MRAARTFAERVAAKEKREAQLRAKAQLMRNSITYTAGREVRRQQKAPVYAVLSQPPDVQELFLPLLDAICLKPETLRLRFLKAFAAQVSDERLFERCEQVISGKSPKGWSIAEGGTDQEAAE